MLPCFFMGKAFDNIFLIPVETGTKSDKFAVFRWSLGKIVSDDMSMRINNFCMLHGFRGVWFWFRNDVLRMYPCVTRMLPVELVWCFSHDLSDARVRSSYGFDFVLEMMHGDESRVNIMSAKTLHWRSPWCVLTFFFLHPANSHGLCSN